jgi:hypothetical protein
MAQSPRGLCPVCRGEYSLVWNVGIGSYTMRTHRRALRRNCEGSGWEPTSRVMTPRKTQHKAMRI